MLNYVAGRFGLNPVENFTPKELVKDTTNAWHGKLKQVYKGIPVRGGEVMVTLRNDEADSFCIGFCIKVDEDATQDKFIKGLYLPDVSPKILHAQAQQIARDYTLRRLQPPAPQDPRSTVRAGRSAEQRIGKLTSILEIHTGVPNERMEFPEIGRAHV